jgi:four helix bundle protein
MHDYRQLDVWRRSHALVLAVYRMTARFPRREMYGLISQMRRSAASIPTNLAEGSGRRSSREFARFVDIAIGSSTELEYQLRLSTDLGYAHQSTTGPTLAGLGEIRGMLHGLARRLHREHLK